MTLCLRRAQFANASPCEPPSPWTQRPGQVIDKTGRPLPHARIQLVGREEAYTDNEGRFFIRVPVYENGR